MKIEIAIQMKVADPFKLPKTSLDLDQVKGLNLIVYLFHFPYFDLVDLDQNFISQIRF